MFRALIAPNDPDRAALDPTAASLRAQPTRALEACLQWLDGLQPFPDLVVANYGSFAPQRLIMYRNLGTAFETTASWYHPTFT